MQEARKQMQKALDDFLVDIGTLRSGRPTPSLIQNIKVPAYGGTQILAIQELANIAVSDQSLTIEPWDTSIIGDIKKGIEAANMGVAPSIDGEVIRLAFPPLTMEDRERLVKSLRTKLEASKISVRQARAEAMKNNKNLFEKKEISENQRQANEKDIQDLTDEFISKLDSHSKEKEESLTTV